MVSRPRHIPYQPSEQSGTEVDDNYGCHPASAVPTVVGGLCFCVLSAIVGLWKWMVAQ